MFRLNNKIILQSLSAAVFVLVFSFLWLPKGALSANPSAVPPVPESTPTSDKGGPSAGDAPGAASSDKGGPTTADTPGYDPAHPTTNQGVDINIQNPLYAKTLTQLLKDVIKLLIQLGIPVAVLFIIYAGFKYVTARGNTKAVEQAHEILLWTVVGIAVLMGSMVIAEIVANTINSLTK